MAFDEDLIELAGGNAELLDELHEILPTTKSMSAQAAEWDINTQDSCPFFTRFPPEVRREIFSYALSEHNSHFGIDGDRRVDFPAPEPKWLVCELAEGAEAPMPEHSSLENVDITYYTTERDPVVHFKHHHAGWIRPGTSVSRFQHTSLLRTCRRVFLEARDLLMQNATLRIFIGFEGDMLPNAGTDVHSIETMTRYTANRLTSLEIYLEQDLLESGFLSSFEGNENLRCIEDFRITIRKEDWGPGAETFGPELSPYDYGHDPANTIWTMMDEHMTLKGKHDQTRAPIPPMPYKERKGRDMSWGESLGMMPNLKRFTMDFEFSEDKFDRLKKLAEWAQRVWTFRLGGKMKGYYLSAEGNPVKAISWRGLTSHAGGMDMCSNPECPRDDDDEEYDPDIYGDDLEVPECCAEAFKFMEHGFGPRMYTFTVTWTARKLEPEDGDDPNVPGPDELKAKWPEVRRDALVPKIGWEAFEMARPYSSDASTSSDSVVFLPTRIPKAFQDSRVRDCI